MSEEKFLDRLTDLLGTKSTTEIARKLDLSIGTISNYFTRSRIPNGEILIRIVEKTNVNLNWLLTGTGAKFAAPDIIAAFSESEKRAIAKIAARNAKSFERQVREIVIDFLADEHSAT